MPQAYIARRIPDSALAIVRRACAYRMWPEEGEPPPPETLRREAADCVGLLTMLTDRVDEELLAAAPDLKIVANMAVGYDNIDVEACTRRGVMVTNTPDVLTETTADLVFALLLATARRLHEAQRTVLEGRWRTWSPMMLTGQDVHGATLGIIGAGRIGQAVGRRAKGFNMRILYHNRRRAPAFEQETGAEYAEFDRLLAESDFVVPLTPLTPQTRGLIGREAFKKMKKSAILINASRGAVVDEAALYEALVNGEIWAAGLDVFENEPAPPDHPLLQLPNVTALPHIGSASIRTRVRMAELAAENLVAGIEGRKPPNLINLSVFSASSD